MMYKYLLFLFITVLHTEIFSQHDQPEIIPEDTIYAVAVEEMPEAVDGVEGIASRLYYTEEALNAKIEGRIYILAYVNEDGNVDKVKILKGLGYGLDGVATNAILHTKFTPGRQNDIPVKVQVSIPLVFKL